jgi:hypothetical protein
VGFAEVAADPFFEVFGFTDVKNLAVFIQMLVDPGLFGQGFQQLFNAIQAFHTIL